MPNENYIAGRAFEYSTKKVYEAKGYTVLRTAGSHGEYDLVAYRPWTPVLMIQCKRVATQAEAVRLIRNFREEPPMPPGGASFQQRLEVKVKGSKERHGVTV